MNKIIVFAVVLLCVLLQAGAFAVQLTLNGRADSVIVVGEDASAPEKNAARELAGYIKKISGASLEIVSAPRKDMNNIYVGQTKLTKALVPDFDWDSLKEDGILIKSAKKSLILAGGRPRGTVYAVYDFLERYLKVRYLTKDCEVIPENKSIRIADTIKYSYTPKFFSREAFYRQNTNNEWEYAKKLKLNGYFNNIPEEWGGRCELIGFCHTFGSMLLPKEEYFAEHPEWYALRDGKRNPTQPCLSNPEVLDKLTENVLKELDKRENPRMISVTQNDNNLPCQCEKCRAMAGEFGGESGLLINALNYISAKIKDKYPNVLLETFAYQYTLTAPSNIAPADNVVVRLCDIENNFAEPITEQSGNGPYKLLDSCHTFYYVDQQTVNRDFYRNLQAWSRLCKQLFIWNYTVNFSNYYIMHPNFHVLKKDIKAYADNNVCAVYEQGDCFNPTAAFNTVKQYLLAHLLWNPDADDDAIIRDFMKNYYGAAWEDLYNVITLCETAVRDKHIFLSTYMNDMSWLSAEEMIDCFGFFNSALAKVSDNIILRDRVYNELMCFQTGWFAADSETQKTVADSGNLLITDTGKFAKAMLRHAEISGNSFFAEGSGIEFSEFVSSPEPPKTGNIPKECEGRANKDWIEITPDNIYLGSRGVYTEMVDDPAAVTGKAALLYANSVEWAMLKNLTREIKKKYNEGYRTMKIYADVRTEGKRAAADEREALDAILFDTNREIGRTAFMGKELSDTYQTVDMGTYELWRPNDCNLYFVTRSDDDYGKGIFFSRLFMIFE